MYLRWLIFYIIFKYTSSQFIVKPYPKNASFLVPRIVGGRPAQLGDVPYQVAFKSRISKTKNRYITFCGGVIIAPKKLLTAAHCFEPEDSLFEGGCCDYGNVKQVQQRELRSIYAVAGNLNNIAANPRLRKNLKKRRSPTSLSTSKIRRIPEMRRHSWDTYSNNTKYENRTIDTRIQSIQRQLNAPERHYRATKDGQWRLLLSGAYPRSYRFPKHDIAVITIRRAFYYNNNIKPIPIASKHIDYDMTCLASGYGRIDSKKIATQLLLADLDTIPIAYCNLLHRRNMIRFICTRSRLSDTAKGDSGGPLVCKGTSDHNDKGAGVVVGIVSGHREGAGSFFTRVSAYRSFIRANKAARKENSIVLIVLTIYTGFCLF